MDDWTAAEATKLHTARPSTCNCVRACLHAFIRACAYLVLSWCCGSHAAFVTRPSLAKAIEYVLLQFTQSISKLNLQNTSEVQRRRGNNTVTALLETDLYAEGQLLHVCICICLQKMPWNTLGSHANTPMVFYSCPHHIHRLLPKTKKTSEEERGDKHTLPILASGHP